MAEELQINATGQTSPDLPPIQMSPELQKEMTSNPLETTDGMGQAVPLQFVTPAQIATFIKAAYQVHGLGSGYADIWQESDEFYAEVAEGIAPDVNAFCGRFPVVGTAIKTVDSFSHWGKLAWSYCLRMWMTVTRKRQEKAKAQSQEEETSHVTTQSAKPVQQQRAASPIVDYQATVPAAAQPGSPQLNVELPDIVTPPGVDPFRVDYSPVRP